MLVPRPFAIAKLNGQGAQDCRKGRSFAVNCCSSATVELEITSFLPTERASTSWAGAVDSIGSVTLANVLASTRYRGVVAACGLAQGMDLPASVLPFILRNVTLAGIDSVNAPQEVRIQAWSRLARDLDLGKLARTTHMAGLAELPAIAGRMFEGRVQGRTVVDVNA